MDVMAAILVALPGTALLVAIVVLVIASRWRRGGDDAEGEGGGGNLRVPPHRPPDAPSGDEPEWWPEFERSFADYVRDNTWQRT